MHLLFLSITLLGRTVTMSSVIHSWAEIPKDRTKLSSLHPGFVPLVAQNDAAFENIFSSKTIEDFRAGWAHLRGNFPTNVPSSGYIEDICSATIATGREISLQITRPDATEGNDVSKPLPVLFVLHGGGKLDCLPWPSSSDASRMGGRLSRDRGWYDTDLLRT